MLQDKLNSKEFLIGIVEGFYGRPWDKNQRLRLLGSKNGLNTYVYAPKDDIKHRAFWRELYTVEETEHLIGLVAAAKENNIDFFYSLSPGIDISYSSEKDISALKRKLEQVTQVTGCSAIALLFDDIEPEMSKKDKEVFQSFAQAQVSVTNEVFHHLKIKQFLFCPTQYCSSRAVPDVTTSEYLNTLGKQLDKSIGILWTGPQVISKELTIESIQKISDVLKRKPIIWDNIFANDYDQKRIFLGPYSGRSPEIISFLSGILVNPNCEFNANVIGIATLAHWTQCSADMNIKHTISDVKLETEIEDGLYSHDVPRFFSSHNSAQKIYHPRLALINAINEIWLPEFHTPRNHVGTLHKPHPPITMVVPIPIPHINTCMTLTAGKTTTTMAKSTSGVNSTQLHAFAEVCSSVSESLCTQTQVVMNSLISPTKVITTEVSINQTSQPNDIPFLNNEADTLVVPLEVEQRERNRTNDEAMDDEHSITINNKEQTIISEDIQMYETSKITSSDILLLCDLFYLPFEHGEKALLLLNEFQWIKSNAQVLLSKESELDAIFEWKRRSTAFQALCQNILELTKKIAFCENREICYDLYSYVWEVSSITSILYAYVLWLELGKFPQNIQSFIQGNYTYFSKGWDEAFTSGNNEPWVFRGGLTADLQRLIPIDAAIDLFNYVQPEKPITTFYNIRLYKNKDEKDVYDVCHSCCLDGSDCSELFPPGLTENIPSDRLVGPFLTLSPEFCVVIECENSKKVIGYACAGLDAKHFYRMQENVWIPEMCLKYPISILSNECLSNAARDTINHFHSFKIDFPQKVLATHPSIITISILKDHLLKDQNLSKRLITILLAALRSTGSFGVFCCINVFDNFLYDFYTNLGFIELIREDSKIYLGRNF